ncbi:MAG: hypothetical protein K6B28_11560 [Lachnospiraceae bacterium]|nr:hypothetical protein [Lachnospiraceae bacterium]
MDKYEYQVCADQIKLLIANKRFAEAMDIADTVDWRRVKSVSMLCTVGEIYKYNKRYEESRDIYLLAYERYPKNRTVVYGLCEIEIKLKNIVQAIEFYKEYKRINASDIRSYILLYKIYEAQDVSLEERIEVLKEYKSKYYEEKWGYKLAYLYHLTGQETNCIEECDELFLWFGNDDPLNKYVAMALQLKMQHTKLNPSQEEKLRRSYPSIKIPKSYSDEPSDKKDAGADNNSEKKSTETDNNIKIKKVGADENKSPDIYSTLNLQTELQKSVEEYLSNSSAEEKEVNEESIEANLSPEIEPEIRIDEGDKGITVSEIPDENIARTREFVLEDAFDPEKLKDKLNMEASDKTDENEDTEEEEGRTLSGNESEEKVTEENIDLSYEDNKESEETDDSPEEEDEEVSEVNDEEEDNDDGSSDSYHENATVSEDVNPDNSSTTGYEENYTGSYTENNLAQHSREVRNRNKNINKYDELLGEEYDGQITISSTIDGDMVEKQITGQISIEDFLKSIEERKARKKRKRENKDYSQTDDLLAQLKDVLPILSSGNIKSLEESKPVLSVVNVPETFMDETENDLDETDRLEKEVEKALLEDKEENPEEDGDAYTESDEELSEDEEYSGSDEESAEDEEYSGIDEESAEYSGSDEEPAEDDLYNEDDTGTEDDLYASAEETDEEDLQDEESVSDEEGPADAEEGEEDTEEDVNIYEHGDYERDYDPGSSVVKDNTSEIRAEFKYDLDDYGAVEELEVIEQPDEVDDIISTSNMPLDMIAAEYDAMAEQAYYTDTPMEGRYRRNGGGREKHPSYMVMEETVKSKRDFDEEEAKLFGRYDGIEPLKAQLVDAIDDMSMVAAKGNVVVMGDEGTGRRNIAIDMVKAMQAMDSSFLGKVAKISGEALNKKNIASTLRKLSNGALIVENAGGLTADTMNVIGETLVMSQDTVLVVLEGIKETMQPLLDSNSPLLEVVFDARVDIADFTNDDLVAYARGYAREKEYSIDEMGTLALYTQISDMQKLDHKVSIFEVMEIVDEAIVHVDKKTFAHFLDVLFSRRYDDNDFIILREKDFNFSKQQ